MPARVAARSLRRASSASPWPASGCAPAGRTSHGTADRRDRSRDATATQRSPARRRRAATARTAGTARWPGRAGTRSGSRLCSRAPTAMATPSASTMPTVAPIHTPAQLWSLASVTVASIVLSPSSARTNDETTANTTKRGSATRTSSSSSSPRPSRQVHTANSRNAMAAAKAIGRSRQRQAEEVADGDRQPVHQEWRRSRRPDSTTHQRWRSAYVMVISCDLSPSSATNTTARLIRMAREHGTTFRRVADGHASRPVRLRSKVSPTAPRIEVRFAGRACASMSTRRLGATPLR